MKVLNIRSGFATNSSSSHSIILMDGQVNDRFSDYDYGFGWDFFTLASVKAKKEYLAAWLAKSLEDTVPITGICALVNSILDLSVSNDDVREMYIDHDSFMGLPTCYDTGFINIDFFKDIVSMILTPGVVILGGNDNEEVVHPLYSKDKLIATLQPQEDKFSDLVAIKDENSGDWTLFSRALGYKVRLDLSGPNALQKENVKPKYPELVDLKITDFCIHNCEFCYQGSSATGAHGKDINNILYQLKEMKVLEVAIGGGEPTSHPDFVGILENAKRYGIVPNFSTKDIGWLHNPITRPKIIDAIGAFAYSVTKPEEITHLCTTLRYYSIPIRKATIQIIPDILSKQMIRAIFKAAAANGITVTLLGVKETGRGIDFVTKHREKIYGTIKNGEWAEVVKERIQETGGLGFSLGVDTLIAARDQRLLEELGVPANWYYVKEGQYSMYVDATGDKVKIGPSSFCAPEEIVTVNNAYGLQEATVSAFKEF